MPALIKGRIVQAIFLFCKIVIEMVSVTAYGAFRCYICSEIKGISKSWEPFIISLYAIVFPFHATQPKDVIMQIDKLITPWLVWFLIGIGLAFLELYLPGFIVLFFGLGCWFVAGSLLLWDLSLNQQLLIFLVTTIVSLLLLRKWVMQIFRGASSDKQDDDFDDFPKGTHVRVMKTITPTEYGRIQYRGTAWYATAEETIEQGATVEIMRFADDSRQIYVVRKIK